MKHLPFLLAYLCWSNPGTSQCNADFTYTISESAVFFYASDSSDGKKHVWYLGDGTTQMNISPQKRYFPGAYEVKHVVYDSARQCQDSSIQEITISYEPQCHSSFYYHRSQADPNHITFYPSVYGYGTNVTQLTWTVNGVIASTSSNEWKYSFTPPSPYIVALTVATSSGCSSTYTDTITTFRQCDFDLDFEAQVHLQNARAILFEPVFYDSSLLYNLTTMETRFPCCQYNTFSEPGNYTVTMVATDSITGCFDTITRVIVVKGNAYDSCTAYISATEKTPGQYLFSAISNQPVTQQYWKVCDARGLCDSMQVSSGEPVSYIFRDTGYYAVRLQVTTQTGCTREVADMVRVQHTGGSSGMRLSSYPNPAQNQTTLYVDVDQVAPITITVYNNAGKQVYRTTTPAWTGKNKLTIPIQALPKGQYYIHVLSADRIWKSVFQKL